jgi:hypothetical protein
MSALLLLLLPSLAAAGPPPSAPASPGAPGSAADSSPAPLTPEEKKRSEQDRDALARALERLLIEQGGLLLKPGSIEIAPGTAYAYTASDDTLVLEGTTVGTRMRQHLVQGTLTLRLGIVHRLQLEVSSSFRAATQSTILAGSVSLPASSSGLGDTQATLTYQLRQARQGPDVLVAALYRAPTGSGPFDTGARDVSLGSGAHGLGGSLSLVTVMDPLVLLATGSVLYGFPSDTPNGRVKVGMEYGATLGVLLAVSPATSLSFMTDARYHSALRRDGTSVLATDQMAVSLNLGLAIVLNSRLFLDITPSFGLTPDAPAFSLSIAVPFKVR